MKSLILINIGGAIYVLIELLWRGHSNISMYIIGGICFYLIGLINNFYTFKMGLIEQMLISCGIVTVVEFISGYILNIKLGLNIWDYSNLRYNLKGQISLLYSSLWFLLSGVAIVLDDYLRYILFKEEKPHYTII